MTDDEDISSGDEDYGGVERVDDNNDVISSEQSEVDSDNNEDLDVMNNDNENSDDEQWVGTNDDLSDFSYSGKNETEMWLKDLSQADMVHRMC